MFEGVGKCAYPLARLTNSTLQPTHSLLCQTSNFKPNRLKRCITSLTPLDFFTPHPRPYQPNVPAVPPPKPLPPVRTNSLAHPLPPTKTTPGKLNTVFIHPSSLTYRNLIYMRMALLTPSWTHGDESRLVSCSH